MIIEERMASRKFSRKARAAGLTVALGLAILGASSNNADARPAKPRNVTTECTTKKLPKDVERCSNMIGNLLVSTVTTDKRDAVFTDKVTGEKTTYKQTIVRTREYDKNGKRTRMHTVTTRSTKPKSSEPNHDARPTTPPSKPTTPSRPGAAAPAPTTPSKPNMPSEPMPSDPDFNPGQPPELPPTGPRGMCVDGVTFEETPCDPAMEARQEACYESENIWRNPTPEKPMGDCIPYSDDLYPNEIWEGAR